ncbi:MAG: hypothetical protein Q4D13_07975 [Erysipelotrichaceae bacterium]|nr:hypothetical protein [Erysipelotrichaceae bacterium]
MKKLYLKRKSLEEPVSQHKKGEKVFITEQAIKRIRKVKIKGISEEAQENVFIAHQKLLKYSKEYNDSNETGCAVDLLNCCITEMVKGDINTLNLRINPVIDHMYRTAEEQTIVICHNHPGLSYFSLNDIAEFLNCNCIKTMTIVTNAGKVMYISKNESYDRQYAVEKYKMMVNKADDIDSGKTVRNFLKKNRKLGIEKG